MGAEDGYRPAWDESIRDKNIFSPDRKAGPAKRELQQSDITRTAPVTAPVQMPSVSLSGIILNPDGSFTAYLRIGDKPATGMREGDMNSGIVAEKIEERAVTLMWEDKSFTIKLQSSPLMKKKKR